MWHGHTEYARYNWPIEHASADAGQCANHAHIKTNDSQEQKTSLGHGVLLRSIRISTWRSAPASARNTDPTEISTTAMATIIINGTRSRANNAPSSTAISGTTRLVVAS